MSVQRERIYQRTKAYLKDGRWGGIIIAFIVNALIIIVLEGILIGGTVSNVINLSEYIGLNNGELQLSFPRLTTIGLGFAGSLSIQALIINVISAILSGGLALELLRAIRLQDRVDIKGMFEIIKDNIMMLSLVSVVIGIVTTLLYIIPIIGWVISVVVHYIWFYSIFLIFDYPDEAVGFYLRESNNKTKGHKMNLFLIELYYYLKPFIGLLFVLLGFIIGTVLGEENPAALPVAALCFFGGIIAIIVLGIKYMPYALTAGAIYYNDTSTADHD